MNGVELLAEAEAVVDRLASVALWSHSDVESRQFVAVAQRLLSRVRR
jgi:hypothetical protein